MEQLPRDAAAILAEYRAAKVMPRERRARVLRRLQQPTATPSPSRLPWVAAAAGVAAVGVFGWGISLLGARQTSDQVAGVAAAHEGSVASAGGQAAVHDHRPDTSAHPPKTPPDPGPMTASATEPPADATDPVHGTAAASPPLKASTGASPIAVTEHRATTGRRANPRRPAAAQPATTDPGAGQVSPLAAERAILARAWAALARGEHSAALAETQTHRQRFVDGTLHIERQAIDAIATCQAKRNDAADVAASFLRAHGKTPLAPRVRQACLEASGTAERKLPVP